MVGDFDVDSAVCGTTRGPVGPGPQQAAAITGLAYNVGGILGYGAFGFLADAIGRKRSIFIYYLGALLIVWGLFLLVRDPGCFWSRPP